MQQTAFVTSLTSHTPGVERRATWDRVGTREDAAAGEAGRVAAARAWVLHSEGRPCLPWPAQRHQREE